MISIIILWERCYHHSQRNNVIIILKERYYIIPKGMMSSSFSENNVISFSKEWCYHHFQRMILSLFLKERCHHCSQRNDSIIVQGNDFIIVPKKMISIIVLWERFYNRLREWFNHRSFENDSVIILWEQFYNRLREWFNYHSQKMISSSFLKE